MEKTHIPTWAESNQKRYHLRNKLEHFIYNHDPGNTSEEFRRDLSAAIEQAKRWAIRDAKKKKI